MISKNSYCCKYLLLNTSKDYEMVCATAFPEKVKVFTLLVSVYDAQVL